MTDIGVFTQPYQTEDRSWLLNEFEDLYAIGGTLSVAAFTQAVHYPNGYLPSGTAVAVITASGLLGPYDSTAADGRQTVLGLTVDSIRFVNPIGGLLTKVGVAVGVAFGVVSLSKLPFNSTNATANRGYIDTAAQTALRNFYFAA